QTSATRIGRRRFVIVIVRASLSKSGHQRRDACRRPALDDQLAGRFDIHTFTRAERDVAAAGAARDAYASLGDKDRGLSTFRINRPFGAPHRGDRLWRRHVEPVAARLLRYFDQQGLAAEFNGIDLAVAVAIP